MHGLLKYVIVIIAAIVVYNFFFGTSTEQDNSRKIFGEVRTVIGSVADLVKSEKTKFDAGKYDAALEKLGGAYKAVRSRAQYMDSKVINRLDELEQRKANLQNEIDAIDKADQPLNPAQPAPSPKKGLSKATAAEQTAAKVADQDRRKAALQKEIEKLLQDSADLIHEADKN